MASIPAEYLPDFWHEISSETSIVQLTCLLPTGTVLLEVSGCMTLADIKTSLWQEAQHLPFFSELLDVSKYLFKIINSLGEEETANDWERLCDLKPAGAVLIVRSPIVFSEERFLNMTIGPLIGKYLQEFDALNCAEVNEFRKLGPDFLPLSKDCTEKNKLIINSWSILDQYRITLGTATQLNFDSKKPSEVGIQVGIFHGGQPLCQPLKTKEQPISDQCEVKFDDELEFDIQVCNIPRNAKLCFVLYELNKGKIRCVAWANVSVYDYKGRLRKSVMTLYMWSYAESVTSNEMFKPLGTVSSNPNREYATILNIIFVRFFHENIIEHPSFDFMVKHAESVQVNIVESETYCEVHQKLLNCPSNFFDMHEQDRKCFWQHRLCLMQHMPEILPKLLSCIDWDNRKEIGQVMALLNKWPLEKVPIEKSIELLDYAHEDPEVRKFAVKCLENISDDDLLLYLLQLVQAIKRELYVKCDLVIFLIKRSLMNLEVGHYLFWHLRCEMQNPSVAVRFGLILEAYCKRKPDHIPLFQAQLHAIGMFKICSEVVKRKNNDRVLKYYLKNKFDKYVMTNPLDPKNKCHSIKVEKCKVMDSKKMPLWIVFENFDKEMEDIHIIFKNGDDLRQDMLILQMLKIFDRLWKQNGLDLRMNLYNCISLENRIGMIEVVLKADTLANISGCKVIAPFKKKLLLTWLKCFNPGEGALSKAINEFTLSCTGYCVATYVLGIGDRHSDNIMVHQNGQLFHIDFGHIFGNFKEKFGIKREQVPFILTYDFVDVITGGTEDADKFKEFQEQCENAFLILRRHADLILSLLSMMVCTGLPELSSEKDLDYVRDTLAMTESEEGALEQFRIKFSDALKNSWKTSLNWAIHHVARNNKT